MLRFFLTFLLALSSSDLLAQAHTLSPSEALKVIFNASEEIVSETKSLNPAQKEALHKKLGYSPEKETWTVFVAKTKGKVDGYALIDHEIGKTEPITFLTAINPDGSVRAVEVLVYRESHGGQVRDQRFLRQFSKKTQADPIRVSQDINNMTGATLSSRALAKGVKRDLIIWEFLYR